MVFFRIFLVGWLMSVSAQALASYLNENDQNEAGYYVGNPVNLDEFDFIVPSGLRHGQPSRNYYELKIGRNGEVVSIKTLKNYPHGKYDDAARTGLMQRRYPPEAAGRTILEEIDYCVMSDGQSTFPCKIGLSRIGVPEENLAKVPGDDGFYKMDKYNGSPKFLKGRLPKYPFQAAMKNMCGWVNVAFTLNHKGEARKIEILGSSGGGIFVPSVVEALRTFRYERDFDKARVEYRVTYEIPGTCFLEPETD